MNKRTAALMGIAAVLLLFAGVFCGAAAADDTIVTIKFNANGGGAVMADQIVTIPEGQTEVLVLLNKCTFTAPSATPEYKFLSWKVNNTTYYTDQEVIRVTGNLTLTAQWSEIKTWDGSTPISNPGYYKLSDDKKNMTAGIIVSAAPVVIDLNGHILSRKSDDANTESFSVLTVSPDGVLTITDSSPDAAHTPEITYTNPITGAPVIVTGGVITGGSTDRGGGVCVEKGTFTMSGGTIIGNASTNRGGGVYVEKGTFTMISGNIIDNNSDYGNGVHVCDGTTFAMTGGNIIGNKTGDHDGRFGGGVYVRESTFIMNEGNIEGNHAGLSAGGVDVGYNGTFIMNGGKIIRNSVGSGGSSEKGGGVCVGNGTFIMNGGSITDNSASGVGGGVYVYVDSTFIMNGGYITNNNTHARSEFVGGYGGGVYVNRGGTFFMNGGSITNNGASKKGGGVYVSDGEGSTFNVSGTPVIKDNGADGAVNNVYLEGERYITVTGQLKDGEIYITNPTGDGAKFAQKGTSHLLTYADAASFFNDNNRNLGAGLSNDRDFLSWEPKVAQLDPVHQYSTVREAVEKAGTTTPEGEKLGTTVTMTADSVEPTINVGKEVTLDLNGHTLSGDDSGPVLHITNGGNFTLCDSGSNGKITGGTFRYGGGAEVEDGGLLTLKSGTITGNSAEYGSGVYVASGGSFTMSGGSITGNTAESDGGGVFSQGSFVMSDGRIGGNTAKSDGGGVYVYGAGTFEFTGGTIELNSAKNGGGVYSSGDKFLLSNDSIIRQNTADMDGGGIYIDTYGKFSMSGGTVSANTAVNNGGGILILADSTLSGGKIVTNTAQNGSGGGVCVSNGTLTISGGKISGNMVLKSENGGGGVFAEGNGVVTMSGNSGRIISNSAGYGGGVCIYNGGTFTLSGGKIGGEAGYGNTANYGGGIYAENGNLTMTGGAVSYNTAKNGGGGVVFYNGTTDNHAFTMSGGLIDLNTSDVKSPAGDYLGRGVVIDCDPSLCSHTIFKMSDGASIPATNDVYLSSGLFITVPGEFSAPDAGAYNICLSVEEPHQTLIASAKDAAVAASSLSHLKLNDSYTSKGYELKIDPANPTQIISVGSHVTVTFVSNGGSPVPSQSIERGKTAVEPAPPVFADHEFKGWFTDDQTFTHPYDFSTPVNDNLTLFAKWDAQYHITYNENGSTSGTAPIDGKAYKSGDSATILSPGDLKKTNHHFDSWNTKADGTGDKYTPDQVIAVTGNLQLFAQWKENQLTVTYDANGATSGTAPVDHGKYNVNDWVTVLGPGDLKKAGYHFNGWKVAGDTKAYAEGSTYQIKTSVTFIAVWDSVETYSLAYNANGATSGSVPETKEYAKGASVTIDNNSGNLEKIGYSFKKDGEKVLWNTAADGTGTDYAGGFTRQMPGEDLALYAQWVPHTYTITYNSNFSTEMTRTQNRSYDDNEKLFPADTFTRTGYTFSGWNTKKDGSGSSYPAGYTGNLTSEQGANITLYAQWTAGSHSVTFHSNGGIFDKTAGSTKKTVSCTIGQPFGNYFPQSVSREGYTLDGWYTADKGGDKVEGSTPVSSTSPSDLYAHWTPITYTIHFNAGGGSGTMADIPAEYDKKIKLPRHAFTREFHTFSGWSTPGIFHLIEDEATVEKLTTKSGDIVTMTAVWDVKLHTVTFYCDGDVYLKTSVPSGSLIDKPSDPEKAGYTFAGWETEDGKLWNFSADTMPDDDLSLIARWEATGGHSITIETDGHGTVTGYPPSAYKDTQISLTVTPESGYHFYYWDVITPETLVIHNNTFTMPDEDVKLFAYFKPDPTPVPHKSSDQGTSYWATPEPTETPTPTPTETPGAPEMPTVKPVATETSAAKSPMPIMGLLAGLGAAAVFGLRRR